MRLTADLRSVYRHKIDVPMFSLTDQSEHGQSVCGQAFRDLDAALTLAPPREGRGDLGSAHDLSGDRRTPLADRTT